MRSPCWLVRSCARASQSELLALISSSQQEEGGGDVGGGGARKVCNLSESYPNELKNVSQFANTHTHQLNVSYPLVTLHYSLYSRNYNPLESHFVSLNCISFGTGKLFQGSGKIPLLMSVHITGPPFLLQETSEQLATGKAVHTKWFHTVPILSNYMQMCIICIHY